MNTIKSIAKTLFCFMIFILLFSPLSSCSSSINNTKSENVTLLQVADVTGKSVSEALAILNDFGFSKIQIEPSEARRNDSLWRVNSQSISPGTFINMDAPIKLVCINYQDYYYDMFAGKSIKVLQDYVETNGLTVKYENTHGYEEINKIVAEMSPTTKNDWIVNKILTSSKNAIHVEIEHIIDLDRILSGYEISYRTGFSKVASYHILLNFSEHIYTSVTFKSVNGKQSTEGISSGQIFGDKETGWRLGSADSAIHYEFINENGNTFIIQYDYKERAEKIACIVEPIAIIERLKEELLRMNYDNLSMVLTPR